MMKKKNKAVLLKKIILVCSVVIIVVSLGIATSFITNPIETESTHTINHIKQPEISEINLVMVGDNLLHMPLIKNGETEDGGYNFDSLYEEMFHYFKNADLSVIVQETVLGGKELGFSGYPLFNSPQEVGDAINRAGFDIVLHATNHSLDMGEKGIVNTINYWKKHPDITVLGLNENEDDYNSVNYIEKNGIKLALLNYTDSTNGNYIPKDKPFIVNTVDEEKIAKDIKIAEENADFTVVFMHWGTEYRFSADEGQKKLAEFMCQNGADLIMGSHPHVIEPVEWIEAENGNKTLVFYSLGNYVSRQKEAANLLGLLGEVKICKTTDKGTYIENASVMPTVTHYNVNSRGFKVYPLMNYTDELASKHGVSQYDGKVSVERFRKIFEDVFKENTSVNLVY